MLRNDDDDDDDDYKYEEEEEEEAETSFAPTDQSLAGDSITVASGQSANSISNCILEELDNAKALLGLTSIAAEDLMEILGENSHSGYITLPKFQECFEYTTQLSGLDKVVNDLFLRLFACIFILMCV